MKKQKIRTLLQATLVAVATLSLAACQSGADVPAELPRPDDTPPATDKPVKVYIMSGQSNMVGFGRVDGGAAAYPSIYLSADPAIQPCRLPVGESALLPHHVFTASRGDEKGATARVYQGAYDPKADYRKLKPVKEATVALGTVAEKLPSVDGPHTIVVEAYLEVPKSGAHEIHPGFEDSSYAIATVNGQEVYRREPGGEATLTKIQLEKGKRHPLTITYLKGGAANFWMKLVDLKPQGTLEALVNDGRFTCMADEEGNWIERNDVILNSSYLGNGASMPLNPRTRRNEFFGPELGFGYVMGTFHDEPVLLIKASIGNRSLGWDILPPGTESWEHNGKIYPGYGFRLDDNGQPVKPKEGQWYAGKVYDDYTASIHRELKKFDEKYPQFKDQGYEIAGFVWWQGHKDQNEAHAARYEQNLVNLIKAWRKEFNAPEAKWAIATIAFSGWDLSGPGKTIAEAQLAVSDYGKYPEHKGNVKTIEARDFWRDVGESPKNQGYHYHHNAETYLLTGDALGRAMVEMLGGTAAPRELEPRPQKPDAWPENPTLEEAVRMVYSDAFINTWSNDPAEPTQEDFERMQPALRPIILDEVATFVQAAPKVPGYLGGGVRLLNLLKLERPEKPQGMTGQMDTLISYYNAAGIHDYDWKPFGPEMRNGEWWYYSFDPPEKLDPGKSNRYREITLPKGMDNWFAQDFNPARAGWKKGQAPFGQVDGELKPNRGNEDNPPNTLWEKEVLLLRQTFDLPELRDDRRYRLYVGGAEKPFSGEGFAVYVNGKLFAETKSGFFKRAGKRGEIIWSDWLPEFQKGKVTIAVKSFLRTTHWVDRAAPPNGHLSVWIEEVKLPEIVRTMGE